MKVTILGWYGTETIGDRAILAGILMSLSKTYDDLEINLGSLYPFFSERTLKEDLRFYEQLAQKKLKVKIFNSKFFWQLDQNINNSDLVLIGGGPLMHIEPLYMLEYAFALAKKKKKKTAIMGCGIGPLFTKNYKKSVINIIKNSDVIILRDSTSKNNLKNIFKEFKTKLNLKKIMVSFDPSVIACLEFLKTHRKKTNSQIAVNLREFPIKYSDQKLIKPINNSLLFFIKNLAKKFKRTKINLIPMHYFHVGNDDRDFFCKIKTNSKSKNIIIQKKPINLEQTMQTFANAKFCVGMRFHSVIFETLLSGKNYVLDYTEPKKGKISGFIKDIDQDNFYQDRYINLQSSQPNLDLIKNTAKVFKFNKKRIKNSLEIYSQELTKFL